MDNFEDEGVMYEAENKWPNLCVSTRQDSFMKLALSFDLELPLKGAF